LIILIDAYDALLLMPFILHYLLLSALMIERHD